MLAVAEACEQTLPFCRETYLVDDERRPSCILVLLSHSDLKNCAILAKNCIQLFSGNGIGQVPYEQNPIHFGRKFGLKKGKRNKR